MNHTADRVGVTPDTKETPYVTAFTKTKNPIEK